MRNRVSASATAPVSRFALPYAWMKIGLPSFATARIPVREYASPQFLPFAATSSSAYEASASSVPQGGAGAEAGADAVRAGSTDGAGVDDGTGPETTTGTGARPHPTKARSTTDKSRFMRLRLAGERHEPPPSGLDDAVIAR
jgi:hypothetical protein